MNFRYPVFLDVSGKRCVVTGAGYEVPGKVEALVEAGATTLYIHPEADARIAKLAEQGLLTWEKRSWQPEDLAGCFLLIADTENNQEIFEVAEQNRVLCNAVDDPAHCRFSFGSIHRQGELTIAISTNGWAPAVAVRLKEWLQREIGPEYAVLLAMLKKARPEIADRVSDFASRRELWYEIVDSPVLDLLKNGDAAAAQKLLDDAIQAKVNSTSRSDISGGDDAR